MQYHWVHYLQHWTSAVSSCYRPRDTESYTMRRHSWQDLQVCARWMAKSEFKPYRSQLTELTLEGGILMWGIRVVIRKGLQPQVIKSLHANHPGISRMKAITRSHFWWEGLDKEIVTLRKSCQSCQSNQTNPAVAPLHPWVWPGSPWEQIHVDFAEPFLDHMFLLQLMRTLSGRKSL